MCLSRSSTIILLVCCLVFTLSLAAEEAAAQNQADTTAQEIPERQPAPRKMLFYKNVELNIRFRHYEDPDWNWEIDRNRRYKTLIIESPQKFYPVTLFEITPFGDSNVAETELREVAVAAMQMAKRIYGLAPEVDAESVEAKTWGNLQGYQTRFDAKMSGVDMSILYFVGRDNDGRIVTMSATTQAGKLTHIKDHIRRTFNWIEFLEPRKLEEFPDK